MRSQQQQQQQQSANRTFAETHNFNVFRRFGQFYWVSSKLYRINVSPLLLFFSSPSFVPFYDYRLQTHQTYPLSSAHHHRRRPKIFRRLSVRFRGRIRIYLDIHRIEREIGPMRVSIFRIQIIHLTHAIAIPHTAFHKPMDPPFYTYIYFLSQFSNGSCVRQLYFYDDDERR